MTEEKDLGLNGAAYRGLTQLEKIIKTQNDTLMPGVCQIELNPLVQRSEPMTLTASANAGQPSICC